ncbi:MAG: right-handed parallel beta-helix repeat-containing protein, partial [Myxococcota bacterium]
GEALIGAEDGTIVAVGKGSYDEAIELPTGVTVQGACAAETTISFAGPSQDRAVVTALLPRATLRDIAIGPSGRPGIGVGRANTSLTVEGVVIDGATEFGMFVDDQATATLDGVLIQNSQSLLTRSGVGLYVQRNAEVTMQNSVLLDNRDSAILVNEAGVLTVERSVVARTLPAVGAPDGGKGIQVQLRGNATLRESVFRDNVDMALFVVSPQTFLTGENLLIRATTAREIDGKGGQGFFVQDGATGVLRNSTVAENQEAAVVVTGATATLEDVIVRDTLPGPANSSPGFGLLARERSTLTLRRMEFLRNRAVAVAITDPDTTGTLEDLRVEGTLSDRFDDALGHAMEVGRAAQVTGARIVIRDHLEGSIVVDGADTMVVLEDVDVEGTGPRVSDGRFGRAVNVANGAELTLRRARLASNRELGVLASAATVILEAVHVVDTRSEEFSQGPGRGIQAQNEAILTATDVRVERSQGVGVLVLRSTATVAGLELVDVAPVDCAATTCPDEAGALGFAVQGGTATVDRFVIEAASFCGVQLAEGSLDLQDGTIRGHSIGACVQVDGYDTTRLTDTVEFEANDVPIQATTIPIAMPAASLADIL